jgi:hypothetical protein
MTLKGRRRCEFPTERRFRGEYLAHDRLADQANLTAVATS